MAGKRSATSDLNHDNWNQDEEPEDAGTFQKASEESLKRRIIKTARRRNPISSVRDTEPDTKSAFTGFTGFSKVTAPTTISFSFLTNVTKLTEKPNTNGTSESVESSEAEKNISSSTSASNKPVFTESSIPIKNTKSKSDDYYSKLKGLNESVSNWIKQHVDANPLINLQPIFKDYERYFKELEKEEDNKTETNADDSKSNTGNVSSMSTFVFKPAKNIPDSTTEKTGQDSKSKKDTHKFSFGAFSSTPSTSADGIPKFGFSSTLTSNTFSFGNSTSTSKSIVTPSVSFRGNVSAPNTAGFSFSGATPFTFNNVSQPSSTNESNKQKGSDDEEDEPPKVEFTPVVEKDHIYTTRCKVFVKKDGNFGDRGVGNLYLKPIENSEKVQLIVRADTNLGNLLCNFILSGTIPTKRMGNKDVMLVCLPTPEFKPPPVPILLRVKSSEEADKLLEVLEKHKK